MTYQYTQLLRVDSAKELVRNIPVGGGTTVDELLDKINSLQTELNQLKQDLNYGKITPYSPTS